MKTKSQLLSEIECLKERLYTDNLTGLKTRDWLSDNYNYLTQLISVGIIKFVSYVDCDGLKEINDTFGHSAGDKFIKQTAEELKKFEFVVRVGGDEFVVFSSEKPNIKGQFSIGTVKAEIYCCYSSLENLILHAEKKMYEQKGKKC